MQCLMFRMEIPESNNSDDLIGNTKFSSAGDSWKECSVLSGRSLLSWDSAMGHLLKVKT